MSLWTDIRDIGETVLTGGIAGAFNKNIGNAEGALVNKITGRQSAEEKRNQTQQVNNQIQAYRDQTALASSQLNEARAATDAEKRQVNEKQIRTLRRTYRAQGAGLLGVGQPSTQDMDTKLGG